MQYVGGKRILIAHMLNEETLPLYSSVNNVSCSESNVELQHLRFVCSNNAFADYDTYKLYACTLTLLNE